jgi:hypothetical protein
VCEQGLDKIEEEMREAEMHMSLDKLCNGLRLRTVMNRFRHRNITGQQALTRGQGILRQLGIRILKGKLRYGYARNTYLRLKGHGPWEKTWSALEEADVRGINERAVTEEEEAEREQLRVLGEIVEGGIAWVGVVAAGEGTHTLSRIWYSTTIMGDDDADLVEGT